jgi:MSHA biogenesis protein MshO
MKREQFSKPVGGSLNAVNAESGGRTFRIPLRFIQATNIGCASGFHAASGFSLVELIVVIMIVGILAGIVAVFIRSPLEGYMAASRRAELTDTADGALVRIARDLRTALPNSIRVTQSGGVTYLEYLPIEDGGRYRAEQTGTSTGDILDFTSGTDASFDVLGPAVTASSGQYLVIYNLGLDASTDVWLGGNRRVVTSNGTVANLAFTPAVPAAPFPLESPSHRFYLVGAPVTYACNPNSAGGTLHRISGYTLQASQPKQSSDFGTAVPRLLANHLTTCTFSYDPGASQRLGQLTLRIQLSQDGETVTLYREVVVNNDA